MPDHTAALHPVVAPPVRPRHVPPPRPTGQHARPRSASAPAAERTTEGRDGRRNLPRIAVAAMRVTVLIPAHNEAKQITETIASLRRQERPRTTSS